MLTYHTTTQRENSMLTFEGAQSLGAQGITEKLTVSLRLSKQRPWRKHEGQ